MSKLKFLINGKISTCSPKESFELFQQYLNEDLQERHTASLLSTPGISRILRHIRTLDAEQLPEFKQVRNKLLPQISGYNCEYAMDVLQLYFDVGEYTWHYGINAYCKKPFCKRHTQFAFTLAGNIISESGSGRSYIYEEIKQSEMFWYHIFHLMDDCHINPDFSRRFGGNYSCLSLYRGRARPRVQIKHLEAYPLEVTALITSHPFLSVDDIVTWIAARYPRPKPIGVLESLVDTGSISTIPWTQEEYEERLHIQKRVFDALDVNQ